MQGQQGPEGDDPEEERAKGVIEKGRYCCRVGRVNRLCFLSIPKPSLPVGAERGQGSRHMKLVMRSLTKEALGGYSGQLDGCEGFEGVATAGMGKPLTKLQ